MKTAEEKFSIRSDYKRRSIKQKEGHKTKDEYKIVFANHFQIHYFIRQ